MSRIRIFNIPTNVCHAFRGQLNLAVTSGELAILSIQANSNDARVLNENQSSRINRGNQLTKRIGTRIGK